MAYLGVFSVIPDGIEPSFLGCKPSVVPLDHGTELLVDPPGLAPGSAVCGTGVFLLNDEPDKAEGEGLEPPNGSRRRLFSRQVPHPAGCLPSASCGSWNRTNGLLRPTLRVGARSQASLPTATVPHRRCSITLMPSQGSHQAAGAGVEPADTWFKATYFYRQKLPRNQTTRGTGGTRTHAPVLNRHPLCR